MKNKKKIIIRVDSVGGYIGINESPKLYVNEGWVKIWNDDYIFLYRKKNHAERRPHKIALNWLEDSLKYLED